MQNRPITFSIKTRSTKSNARVGTIETPHGVIQTPAFIPVGTKATVKGITPEMLKDLGADSMLANTYHLYLQPGDEIIKAHGGLGKFMNMD
jgi:queuine tRNA-ribosyltransferase